MRFFDYLAKQLMALISNFSDLLEMLMKWPFQGRSNASKSSTWMLPIKLLWLPVALFSFLLNLPLRFYRNSSLENKKDMLLGIPAIVVAILIVIACGYITLRSESIADRYRRMAQRAMNEGEFELAKTIYGRLVTGMESAENEDLLGWAIVLNKTGEFERALALINRLAPDQTAGYGPAHELKAIVLAGGLGSENPPDLNILRWHLQHSENQESEAVNRAWSAYYSKVGDRKRATEYLEKATTKNPGLLLALAIMYGQNGNESAREKTLNLARTHFEPLQENDHLNFVLRFFLARIYVEQREFDLAEKLMLVGYQLESKKEKDSAMADFYLLLYDRKKTLEEDFNKKIGYLQKSLSFDPNRVIAYDFITKLYEENSADKEKVDLLKSLLEEMLVSGESPALAHLLLGNFLWSEGKHKEGRWHLEQSYKHNKRFEAILNNLAWSLAMSEPRDLVRSLELANIVVKNSPGNASYRDTLANVLKLMGKYEEALVEFERVLASAPPEMNTVPVHMNLAEIYDKIGKPNLARQHRVMAEEKKRRMMSNKK